MSKDGIKNNRDSFVTRKMLFASLGMVSFFCVLCVMSAVMFLDDGNRHEQRYMRDYYDTENSMTGISVDDIPVFSDNFGFVIKDHEGKIGIFDAHGSELINTIDVSLLSLPSNEYEILKNGYSVKSVSELIDEIKKYMG